MESLGARFEVLGVGNSTKDEEHYLILDIPPDQVDNLIRELTVIKMFVDHDRGKGKIEPNSLWTVYLSGKARPQKYVGPNKPDGSPPDVSFPQSLLRDDIARE